MEYIPRSLLIVQSGILRNVPRGTTEKWRLESGTGWSHPVHIHLVDFQIVSREKNDTSKSKGRDFVTPYEAAALKDVVVLGENEAVTVLAKYAVSLFFTTFGTCTQVLNIY